MILSFSISPSCYSTLPFFDSPRLVLYILSTHPFGPTMYPSSLVCSCSAQTRAKRLILALRPSKLSQLSSFSPLSLSISSDTLPVVMDTREQAGAFDLLVCGRSQQPVSKIITWRPSQMCQNIEIWECPHREDVQYQRCCKNYWSIWNSVKFMWSKAEGTLHKKLDFIKTICRGVLV